MTFPEVLVQYQRRIYELQAALAQARLNQAMAGAALAVAAALLLALTWQAVRKQTSFWLPLAVAPLALAPARLFRRRGREADRLWRAQRFTERALDRVQGEWPSRGDSGDEFRDPTHPYAADLQILGEGSLFEFLSTARTGVGRRGLAGYLLETAPLAEIQERQEAIRELLPQTGLREAVAALGPFESSESQWQTFAGWLDSPPLAFPALARRILPFTSSAVVLLMAAGLMGLVPWLRVTVWTAPLLAFHAALGLLFRRRVRRAIDRLHLLSAEIQVVREGLELLAGRRFASTKLRRLAEQAAGAPAALRQLERLLMVLGERNKDWFYLPFLVLMAGTQLSMAIERWRAAHGPALRGWLDAWAEFEALNSLACYAYENPSHAFPQLSDAGAHLQARGLGHPLLPYDACVPNDVALDAQSRFYIVSGSNMSGKSTLLRAIGLNAVLAQAGAPVRAESLRLSRFSVVASFSPAESLRNGTSRFLAEVDRLKQAILLAAAETPVLFLVDEIFSGTNSSDRRVASEAVIRTLVARGAMGAISTHDLALAEIARRADLGGVNMHMGSREGGGPLDFDYRLKAGVTTEANALAIARMAGVDV